MSSFVYKLTNCHYVNSNLHGIHFQLSFLIHRFSSSLLIRLLPSAIQTRRFTGSFEHCHKKKHEVSSHSPPIRIADHIQRCMMRELYHVNEPHSSHLPPSHWPPWLPVGCNTKLLPRITSFPMPQITLRPRSLAPSQWQPLSPTTRNQVGRTRKVRNSRKAQTIYQAGGGSNGSRLERWGEKTRRVRLRV